MLRDPREPTDPCERRETWGAASSERSNGIARTPGAVLPIVRRRDGCPRSRSAHTTRQRPNARRTLSEEPRGETPPAAQSACAQRASSTLLVHHTALRRRSQQATHGPRHPSAARASRRGRKPEVPGPRAFRAIPTPISQQWLQSAWIRVNRRLTRRLQQSYSSPRPLSCTRSSPARIALRPVCSLGHRGPRRARPRDAWSPFLGSAGVPSWIRRADDAATKSGAGPPRSRPRHPRAAAGRPTARGGTVNSARIFSRPSQSGAACPAIPPAAPLESAAGMQGASGAWPDAQDES